MTMIEMQNILGSILSQINNPKVSEKERNKIIENAEYMAKIAKQMVNNADVVLRADKLSNRHDRTDLLVGEPCNTNTPTAK